MCLCVRGRERLRQDGREEKKKETGLSTGEAARREGQQFVPVERSRKGARKTGGSEALEATGGCQGLRWMPLSPGSQGPPLPQSQMTFANGQRGEGWGTSGSIVGRG